MEGDELAAEFLGVLGEGGGVAFGAESSFLGFGLETSFRLPVGVPESAVALLSLLAELSITKSLEEPDDTDFRLPGLETGSSTTISDLRLAILFLLLWWWWWFTKK